MGSPLEGCGYDRFGLGIEVCVDGPVGNGETALLEVFTNNSDLSDSKKIGDKSGWDGSIVNFPNWHDYDAAGCDVVSSNVRIQKSNKNDNVVLITVRVELAGCSPQGSDSPYFRCGGPGTLEAPHVLETSRTVNMTSAPGCSDGAIL